ncbi:YycH family regulatory protein [Paenibacillus sp. GCM10023252]|uniref:YycH family regulatory protein n=1 Tax=Paenibacillus sp. GCM10023252 TaxID=3252649 RepID=UPI003607F4FF
MERLKTIALILLVALSLVQSYLLAYSMPGLGATVRVEQDYVNTEPLGPAEDVDSVVFPEELILHFGNKRHSVLRPESTFYNQIYRMIQGREFKGFQRRPSNVLNWQLVRDEHVGIELRFGSGVPVDLLRKTQAMKLDGDLLFLNEVIDRIWIYKEKGSEEVRTYFFSADGQMVFESVRADLTVRDVENYVGFGEYQTLYDATADGIYVPVKPVQAVQITVPYETYSPELMQRNLFFDPSTTRAIEDRNGSRIYTDGKRGLQVEQDGKWISYTDPAAPQNSDNQMTDNVYASVDFINDHGGWDGKHRFIYPGADAKGQTVIFQQYYDQYPVLQQSTFNYGYMKLVLQQGAVTEYGRSLITIGQAEDKRELRWLHGGDLLRQALANYSRRADVESLYPALQARFTGTEEKKMVFVPVWAVRLEDGTQDMLLEAYPTGFDAGALAASEEEAEEAEVPAESGSVDGIAGGLAGGEG